MGKFLIQSKILIIIYLINTFECFNEKQHLNINSQNQTFNILLKSQIFLCMVMVRSISEYDKMEKQPLPQIYRALLSQTIKNKALISLNVPMGSDWPKAENSTPIRAVRSRIGQLRKDDCLPQKIGIVGADAKGIKNNKPKHYELTISSRFIKSSVL